MTTIRPMLDARRVDIERHLVRRGLEWREDASNAGTDYLRNRVRHIVLPAIERELNPRAREAFLRAVDILAEDGALLDDLSKHALADCRSTENAEALEVKALLRLDAALRRRVLRSWLIERGVEQDRLGWEMVEQVMKLLSARGGTRRHDVAHDRAVLRRYALLSMESTRGGSAAGTGAYSVRVAVPGGTRLMEAGLRISTGIKTGILRPRNSSIGRYPAESSISLRALRGRALRVRTWRPGDRMRPPGAPGSRKVQDILTDARVPRELRGRVPLFTCGREIVWIPGFRIAEGWQILDRAEESLHIRVKVL